MRKFKVGDRVVRVSYDGDRKGVYIDTSRYYKIGQEAVVIHVGFGPNGGLMDLSKECPFLFYSSDFELVDLNLENV